jgi:hypothetical protein
MARTYLPSLFRLSHLVRAYCARYDATIRKNMSSEVEAVYDALLTALDALLAVIEIEKED